MSPAIRNAIDEVKSQRLQCRTALVVGPDAGLANKVADTLPEWRIEHAACNATALTMLQGECFELVVTGENTSGAADIELLRKIRRVRPHVRLVILTQESTPDDVIASMREGAFTYFSAPYSAG